MKNGDYLVRFKYEYYAGQGDWEHERITVLVKNVPGFHAAINRIKIVAKKRGWNAPEEFEDMTVDLE